MEKDKTKKKVKKVKYKTAEQEEMRKFILVIVVVLVCVSAVYLLTRAFVTKDLFDKKDENNTEEIAEGVVNYSVAIVGQILNRPYDQYYVVVFDREGDYSSDMSSLVSTYNMGENPLHVYVVDLSNKLNKDFYDPENVNNKAKSVSEFKFGDITLIKVKKGKVDKYITDYAKMQKELKVSK